MSCIIAAMDIITTHIGADFDSLAAMVAAKKLYPDAVLVFPGFAGKKCPRLPDPGISQHL